MYVIVDIDNSIADTSRELNKKINNSNIPLKDYLTTPKGLKVLWRVKPFKDAARALKTLSRAGYMIVYFSEFRPQEAKFITRRWLQRHEFPLGIIGRLDLPKENILRLAAREDVFCMFEDNPELIKNVSDIGKEVWVKKYPYNEKIRLKKGKIFDEWSEVAILAKHMLKINNGMGGME